MWKVIVLVLVLMGSAVVHADALTFNWTTTTNATSYKLYQSADLGVTWTVIGTVQAPPVVVQVAGGKLLLFRVSAINSLGETINLSYGQWWNSAWDTRPVDLVAH